MSLTETQISPELIRLLKEPYYGRTESGNKGMLYMNKLTFEALKVAFMPSTQHDDMPWRANPMGSLFGVSVVCYHSVPFGQYEYVEPYTGNLVTRGNVFKNESSVLTQFVKAAIAALEESIQGTDGGYPDGVSSSISILTHLYEQFQAHKS